MSELYDILTETPPTKVVLLALDQGLWDCERSLAELSALCEANHMEAVAQITQKRQTPETGIVLGSGKLEEASLAAQTLGAECAVFDGELTGSQIRNISTALVGLEVIDRTMLILEIFRLDDAFQIKAVFPVLLHLHTAALPHGGGEAELVVGEQDLEGVDPVAEGLVQLLQQLVQTIAGFGAGQQDIRVKG